MAGTSLYGEEVQCGIVCSLVDDEGMTPEKAVQQILDLRLPFACTPQDRELENHCYFTAWGVISTAARTVSDKQSKIIAFVNQLRTKTVINPSTGAPLECDHEVVWKALPTFGFTFSDGGLQYPL